MISLPDLPLPCGKKISQLRRFSAVGGKEEPEIRKSSSWNSSVLCAWVSPELANGETGLSVILKDASALDGATSLSAKTLMQIPNADGATLRLRLIGRAKNGSVLIYESALESPTTTWQSSTFSISNFVADADLSSPCVLTLVTDSAPVSEGEEDSSYVFWLKGIELRRPTGEFPWQIAAVAVLAGILLGLFLTLLLYRRAARRRG